MSSVIHWALIRSGESEGLQSGRVSPEFKSPMGQIKVKEKGNKS
jgi:hypothetical protein